MPTPHFLNKRNIKEAIIFFVFLVLSGLLWLIFALNDSYEMEISMSVELCDVPKQVVLTSNKTEKIRFSVRDKGYKVLIYSIILEDDTLQASYTKATKDEDKITVHSNEITQMLKHEWSNIRITQMKPDAVHFFYTEGQMKRLPVKLVGTFTPTNRYYLLRSYTEPDSVTVYASNKILASLAYIETANLTLKDFSDTLRQRVALKKMVGMKTIPDSVTIVLCSDMLVENEVEVPITAIGMPAGRRLRTFPTKVKVRYSVGTNTASEINASQFKVTVNYQELISNPSDKCQLHLDMKPQGVKNPRMEMEQVDYLIEQI